LFVLIDGDRRGDIVAQHHVQLRQDHVAGMEGLFAAVRGEYLLCHGHAHWKSPSFLCSMYSMESDSACQEAAMMSVDTPTVIQLCSPSEDSMRTRTLEAVASSPVSTRTL